MWSWGYGSNGGLGNGKTSNSSLPVKVIGVSDVVSIAAGYYNSIIVLPSEKTEQYGHGVITTMDSWD